MRVNNTVMLAAGMVPASVVARALGKNLSTIHRLAANDFVNYTRDGRALYIEMTTLAVYYKGNGPMLERVRALQKWAKDNSTEVRGTRVD
jgi:hypothetical protein